MMIDRRRLSVGFVNHRLVTTGRFHLPFNTSGLSPYKRVVRLNPLFGR